MYLVEQMGMLPCELACRASKSLYGFCVLLWLWQVALVWHYDVSVYWLVASTAALIWAVLRHSKRVVGIRIKTSGGQAQLCFADGAKTWVDAHLLPGSLITPMACFLGWRCQEGVFWQLVLPDMLSVDGFRRLRVWARWCKH